MAQGVQYNDPKGREETDLVIDTTFVATAVVVVDVHLALQLEG